MSVLGENGFFPAHIQLQMNMKYFVVVTIKGRTYRNKYSVFLIKLNKDAEIIYESHEMSFDKLKDAVVFQGYIARNIIK